MSKIINIDLTRGGFNPTQVSILRKMQSTGKSLSMRDLEKSLDKKRLTLYYNLKHLERRGVVRHDKTGKIYTWALAPRDISSGAMEVSISQAYEMIARSSSKRLWGIQGGESVRMVVKNILKGTSYKNIHHRQRLRKVIVDGILTEKGIGLIKLSPKEELLSHLRRATILHATVDTPELSFLEIITDGKILFVIDYSKECARLIRDPSLVKGYLALHETIKALSTKLRPDEVYGY